jgi:hypothetical protein
LRFYRLRNKIETETDLRNPKIHPVSFHPSHFTSNDGLLLQILLLSIHIAKIRQTASTITRPIPLLTRAELDADLRNTSIKTIRLGKIWKTMTGCPK